MTSVPTLQLVNNVPNTLPDPVAFDSENLAEIDENEIFKKILLQQQDIIKIALSCSIPSSYTGKERFLLFPFNEEEEPEKFLQHYINVND